MRRNFNIMAIILAVMFIMPISAQEETILKKLEKEIMQIVNKVSPSVVKIIVVNPNFPFVKKPVHLTGVIFSQEGHIITDSFLIDQDADVEVIINQQKIKATFIGEDKKTGIAVIKIQPPAEEKLIPAEFEIESKAHRGAFVISIGNACKLQNTIHFGIISGLNRKIRAKGRLFEDVLQVSVPLYPGDAGSPVINTDGKVAGLLLASMDICPLPQLPPLTENISFSSSISFALPASAVVKSATSIIEGKIQQEKQKLHLGISVYPIDIYLKEHLNIEDGLVITRVKKQSLAEKFGLKEGDIIIKIDDLPATFKTMRKKIKQLVKTRKMKIEALREGKPRVYEVILTEDENEK